MNIAIEPTKYGRAEREWLDDTGKHYLQNAPPGCLFAIGVRAAATGLLGVTIGQGPLLGLCLVGRPVARALDQTGDVGEVTRMVLVPGLPHGTASAVLRKAADVARARGMSRLIAYHDRTRHTGCIYRKAGFRRDGGTAAKPGAWGSRGGRASATYEAAAKRRWTLTLSEAA
jgi:hypothetical protein